MSEMAIIHSEIAESTILQYIPVTVQPGSGGQALVSITNETHPLLSSRHSKAEKPPQLLVPHSVPHPDMSTTRKAENTLGNSFLTSGVLLTHIQSPQWAGFWFGMCFT